MKRIETLAICITEACNMGCAHCLRGDASSAKMDMALIPNIFDGIDEINTIVFTGGEPSMYPEFVTKCVDYVIEKGIIVHGCYIVTNGKDYCQELVDAVKKLLFREIDVEYGDALLSGKNAGDGNKIKSSRFIRSLFDEMKYSFGISVSIDNYHDPISQANYIKYLASGIYSEAKEVDYSRIGVIARGRGAGLARSNIRAVSGLTVEVDDDIICDDSDIFANDTVYISCDGRVYGDCDLDYDMLEYTDSYGDVSERGLGDIIYRVAANMFDDEEEED